MMKLKSKKQIRQELENEINQYLETGGTIQHIAQGESGKELGANLNQAIPLTQEKQNRTPLTEEIKALDERKSTKAKPEKTTSSSTQPRKKIIYDDFGEPLREVWE